PEESAYEWTPDGKSVIYISNREGKYHVYKQAVGQGTPELVDTGADEANILRLSPDRTEIFYAAMRRGDGATSHYSHDAAHEKEMAAKGMGSSGSEDMFRIMRVPLEGGQPKQILEWPEINNFQCARLPSTECIFSSYANQSLEFYEFDSEN